MKKDLDLDLPSTEIDLALGPGTSMLDGYLVITISCIMAPVELNAYF